MKKLIYLEDAIDAVLKRLCVKSEEYLTLSERCVIDTLKELPSADVRENVEGEWIDDDMAIGLVICSKCRNKGYKNRNRWWRSYAEDTFKFCPNCGAKMEVE